MITVSSMMSNGLCVFVTIVYYEDTNFYHNVFIAT